MVFGERRISDAVKQLQGVVGAKVASDHSLEGKQTATFALTGAARQEDVKGSAQIGIVSPQYFDTTGVQRPRRSAGVHKSVDAPVGPLAGSAWYVEATGVAYRLALVRCDR